MPSRRWNSQNPWRSASETIHLNHGSSGTRRGTRNSSRKIRRTLFSIPASKWLNRRWCGSQKWLLVNYRRFHLPSSRGTPSQTAHAERRIISYPTKVHWRLQNNTYVTGCIVGETYWSSLERGWRKRIIRCMNMLHNIHLVERKATWWIYIYIYGRCRPDMWKHVSDASNQKAKRSKSGPSRNESSIMPDNYVVSSSLNLMMRTARTWKTLVGS